MPENKVEELYVEPTVEVSGPIVAPLSENASDSSVTVCGCCFC